MKRSRPREMKKRAEAAGLEVLDVSVNKSIKMYVRSKDGRTKMITCAMTPSCPHADDNIQAAFRRFANDRKE